MNDLFAAQTSIIAQLTAQVPGLRLVQGIQEMAALHERPGTTPAAYVMYDGQEVRMSAGKAQVVEQKWQIILAVRHARPSYRQETEPITHSNQASPTERQDAGPLLIHACRALLGWRPGPEYGTFSLVNAPNPSFRDGFGFYVLRFMTRLTIT